MSTLSVELKAGPGVSTFSAKWSDASFISNGFNYGAFGNTGRKNKWVITLSESGTLTVYGAKADNVPTGKGLYFYIMAGSKILAKRRDSVSYTFRDSPTFSTANITLAVLIENVPIVISLNAFPGTVSPTSVERNYGDYYGDIPMPVLEGATFDSWYFGQTKITPTTRVEVKYDHTLHAKWVGSGGGDVDTFDDSMMVQSVMEAVEPVRRFGLFGSCRKTFPDTPEGLTPFTGFSNYEQGIPSQYEYSGLVPDLAPNTEGHDYSNVEGYRALLQDINAIGEIATREQYFRQCGGIRTFSKTVSDVIGGYPKGAVLEYWDGQHLRLVASLIDDNTFDFSSDTSWIDGEHWVYADSYSQTTMPAFLDIKKSKNVLFSSFSQAIVSGTMMQVSDWFTAPFDCCLTVGVSGTWRMSAISRNASTNLGIGCQLRQSDGALLASQASYPNITPETGSGDAGTVFGLFAVGDYSNMLSYSCEGNYNRTIYMKAGSAIRFVYDGNYIGSITVSCSYAPLTGRFNVSVDSSTQLVSSGSAFQFTRQTASGSEAPSASQETSSNLPLTYNGDFYLPLGYNGGGVQIYRKLTSAYNAEFGVNDLDLSDMVYRWNGYAFVPMGD